MKINDVGATYAYPPQILKAIIMTRRVEAFCLLKPETQRYLMKTEQQWYRELLLAMTNRIYGKIGQSFTGGRLEFFTDGTVKVR